MRFVALLLVNRSHSRIERRGNFLLVESTFLWCGPRTWNRATRVPSATVNLR